MAFNKKIKLLLTMFNALISCLSLVLIIQNDIINLDYYDFKSSLNQKNISETEVETSEEVVIEEVTHAQSVYNSPTEEPTTKVVASSNDLPFENSLFIGDSRMEGFYMHSGITNGTFYTKKGLSLSKINTEKFIKIKGRYKTIFQAMENKTYDKIFIQLGLNELGWPYIDTFEEKYSQFVQNVIEAQPDSDIYILSILHVSKEKSDNDTIYNNKNINKFNKAIKHMCETMDNVYYIDLNPTFTDKDGAIYEDATTDGVHLTPTYYRQMLTDLRNYFN